MTIQALLVRDQGDMVNQTPVQRALCFFPVTMHCKCLIFGCVLVHRVAYFGFWPLMTVSYVSVVQWSTALHRTFTAVVLL